LKADQKMAAFLETEMAQRLGVSKAGGRALSIKRLDIAQRLRSETMMTWARIASHLQMGTAGYAPNALRLR
jgi:hypothetical protein